MKNIMSHAAKICENILPEIEKFDDIELLTFARMLCLRLNNPQGYITVIGETSTGKSTLINGLFPRDILPARARPTSGTVVHVKLDNLTSPEFYVINKDATLEQVDESLFSEMAEKPDVNTLRLMLGINPVDSHLRSLNIFDTPGYNSLLEEHEESLREFIPNSDLLVFACCYRTGFNQVDQDLFELVKDTIPERDIPIILVINRVPEGTSKNDKRIQEIIRYAQDSLLQSVEILLVNEVDKKRNPELRPDIRELWNKVESKVNDADVQNENNKNLLKLLQEMLAEIISTIDIKISYIKMKSFNLDSLRKLHSIQIQAQSKSIDAVYFCTRRIRSLGQMNIEQAATSILKTLTEDINSSDKWLGKDDTYAWIQGHALPILVKKEGRNIEDMIQTELKILNNELEDIANTAVKEIKKSVIIKSNIEAELLKKSFKRLLQKTMGKYISQALTKLGGRGGIAAGAGNFTKIAVKNVGKIFKKKFSRSVYTKIGRIFNKKLVAKANILLMAAVEVIDFTVQANRWKGKLIKGVAEMLKKWEKEVIKELLDDVIPSIEKENIRDVESRYKEDIKNCENALNLDVETQKSEINALMQSKDRLVGSLNKLNKIIKEG